MTRPLLLCLFLLALPGAAGAQVRFQIDASEDRLPIAYCRNGAETWAEQGTMCHTKPQERETAFCLKKNADGILESAAVACSIPPGFEDAFGKKVVGEK